MPDPSLPAPDAPASAMVTAGHPAPEHSGEIGQLLAPPSPAAKAALTGSTEEASDV